PVEVGFRTQDERAGLPIKAGLAAADRTEKGSVTCREIDAADAERALVARQAEAEITADIKTAPIGDGTIRGWARIDRWAGHGRRQISRPDAERHERKNPHRCCDQRAHGIPSSICRPDIT